MFGILAGGTFPQTVVIVKGRPDGGGGGGDALNSYVGVWGTPQSSTQSDVETQLSVSGTLSNLRVALQKPLRATDSLTFAVCLRASQSGRCTESSLTCTISGKQSSCSDADSSHDENAMAGDWVSVAVTASSATAAASVLDWSAELSN